MSTCFVREVKIQISTDSLDLPTLKVGRPGLISPCVYPDYRSDIPPDRTYNFFSPDAAEPWHHLSMVLCDREPPHFRQEGNLTFYASWPNYYFFKLHAAVDKCLEIFNVAVSSPLFPGKFKWFPLKRAYGLEESCCSSAIANMCSIATRP